LPDVEICKLLVYLFYAFKKKNENSLATRWISKAAEVISNITKKINNSKKLKTPYKILVFAKLA
jgi:hypothetical protein